MLHSAAKGVFWGSLAALAWTHAGYPLAAAALASVRGRAVRKAEQTPDVTVVVAAHDEEAVIERRVRNLLELDYPPEKVDVVVASDASTDGTDGIVAFSDANCTWEKDALRRLVESFADPEVAYVCGQLRLTEADGTNREGAYWRYELWLREQESAVGSITGGNGSIYAVRREDYVEVDPRFGHDLSFPYLMVQRGRRAVYEPQAHAHEKPSRDIEDEYRRKVRMFEHCWAILLEGRMLAGVDPLYRLALVSHRALRYASGLLHLGLLGSSLALAARAPAYRLALVAQLSFLAHAAARPGLPRYYVLVSWATVEALVGYLRSGVPVVWEKAEGTR